MNKISWLFVAISFVMLSCKKMPVASQVGIEKDTVKINFKPQYFDFVYLSTKTKLEYADGVTTDQYAMTLRAKKDSIIWVSIGKAGIEGVRGIIRPDSIFVLDKMKNESYSYDLEYLQNVLQSKLSFKSIQNLLVGDLLLEYNPFVDVLTKNESHFILNQKKDNLTIESFIRFDNFKIDKMNIVDVVTMSKTNVAYNNFVLADSMLVPSVCVLSIDYSKNGQQMHSLLTLTHTKIEFPEKSLNFPFNIPKKYNEK